MLVAVGLLGGCDENNGDTGLQGFRQRSPDGPIATIVGSQEYNFGTAQIGEEGSHVFEQIAKKITNEKKHPFNLLSKVGLF